MSWRNGAIAFVEFRPEKLSPIQLVADSGGTPRTIAPFDGAKEWAERVQLLADSTQMLASVVAGSHTDSNVIVLALDGSDRRVLVRGGSAAQLLPRGHLVYLDRTVGRSLSQSTRFARR